MDNGFGTDASPLSLTGSISVTGGRLVANASAASAFGIYNPTPFRKIPTGSSRRAALIQFRTVFQTVTTPSGGGPNIVEFRGSTNEFGLNINSSRQLGLYAGPTGGAATYADFGSILATSTDYLIEIEYREERDTGIWIRCWVDGSLDTEIREATRALTEGAAAYAMEVGDASGKGTFHIQWDDMKVRYGSDPQ